MDIERHRGRATSKVPDEHVVMPALPNGWVWTTQKVVAVLVASPGQHWRRFRMTSPRTAQVTANRVRDAVENAEATAHGNYVFARTVRQVDIPD